MHQHLPKRVRQAVEVQYAAFLNSFPHPNAYFQLVIRVHDTSLFNYICKALFVSLGIGTAVTHPSKKVVAFNPRNWYILRRNIPLRKYTTLSAGSRWASSLAKNARCGVSSSSLSRRSLRVFPSLKCLATVLSLSLLRWLFGAEDRWLLENTNQFS